MKDSVYICKIFGDLASGSTQPPGAAKRTALVQQHLGLLGTGIPTPALELQADCLAGAFFAASNYVGLIEPGDLEEGMFTSLMYGDYNYWDANHHGTPKQRVQAFTTGFTTPNACF